ncbi:hypothetical protein D3C81_1663560 [compost metagenome]
MLPLAGRKSGTVNGLLLTGGISAGRNTEPGDGARFGGQEHIGACSGAKIEDPRIGSHAVQLHPG